MTASDVSNNVYYISGWVVGTGGTISAAVFNTFYNVAVDQTNRDNAGDIFTANELIEAQALLVCHYIARRMGQSGKISESGIGTYSYSRGNRAGLTVWMDEYNALLKAAQDNGGVTATDLLGDGGTGFNHIDVAVSKDFNLDQEGDKGQATDTTPYPAGNDSYWYGGS